jgi:hypothetical protein
MASMVGIRVVQYKICDLMAFIGDVIRIGPDEVTRIILPTGSQY